MLKTYGDLRKRMRSELAEMGIETPEIEAAVLIAELRGVDRNRALLEDDVPLPPEEEARALAVLERRKKREPWQYIFGIAGFMDLTLLVTPDVLIPRPETELLVENVLQTAPENAAVLDLGCGSGAIALALAYYRADLKVTGVDVSRAALAVAERNREETGLLQVELLESDLFSALQDRKFHVIAANLPYISEPEYADLQREVRDFEPRLALVSGADGMTLLKRSAKEAAAHLFPHGAIIWELDPAQAEPFAAFLAGTALYTGIAVLCDYTRRNRFVRAVLA